MVIFINLISGYLLEKLAHLLLRINKMKKYSVLFFAVLFSLLMLPFAQANAADPLSNLHADIIGEWQLDTINDGDPVGEPTLEIELDRISGYTGCNTVFGNLLALSEDNLQINHLASTMMMCHGEERTQEEIVIEVFTHTSILSFDSSTGELTIGSENNTLTFTK